MCASIEISVLLQYLCLPEYSIFFLLLENLKVMQIFSNLMSDPSGLQDPNTTSLFWFLAVGHQCKCRQYWSIHSKRPDMSQKGCDEEAMKGYEKGSTATVQLSI
jgi:hypothetical protein